MRFRFEFKLFISLLWYFVSQKYAENLWEKAPQK